MDLESYWQKRALREQAQEQHAAPREAREGMPAPHTPLYDEYHQWAFFYLQKAVGDAGLKRLSKRLKDGLVEDAAERLYERLHDKQHNMKHFLREDEQQAFVESILDRLKILDPDTRVRAFDITRYQAQCDAEKAAEQEGQWQRIVNGRLLSPHPKTPLRG